MEYKPSLPEHNDNVSHNSPFSEFITLAAGLSVLLIMFYLALGWFTDVAVDHLSPEMEVAMFSQLEGVAEFDNEVHDPRTQRLQALADRMQSCIDIPYPITVKLVESDEVNAMALPGGTILFYSGLLDKLKTENGLAFVMAHELGHFKNRDHLRGLGRGLVISVASALLMGANSDITHLLTPASALGMAQYSQARETQADETALAAMQCLYGHVGGANEFFESMRQESNKKPTLGHYFSSHPEILKRLTHLKQVRQERHFLDKPDRAPLTQP